MAADWGCGNRKRCWFLFGSGTMLMCDFDKTDKLETMWYSKQ